MNIKGAMARSWLALVGLTLLGAWTSSDWEDLVRQGNAAFAREEFSLAVELYTQAEDMIPDPGLVAFNKAAALYHLGRYREAELHYRRCLEDAEGLRFAQVLYSLGNSLVQQAQDTDARRLQEAIGCYEQCLIPEPADPELAANARHNLELARLLWLQAQANKKSGEQSNREPGEDEPPSKERPGAGRGVDETRSVRPDARGRPKRVLDPRGGPQSAAAGATAPEQPGKGNLPPIPDEEPEALLSADDAADHLRQAAARIERELREHRQRMIPAVSSKVKDW